MVSVFNYSLLRKTFCCVSRNAYFFLFQSNFSHDFSWLQGIIFFFVCLIFIFTLFYFTILYWFWHTLTWICHRCTWALTHEPLSHLPPHIIPPAHPRAPAPSILHPASNIDWRFISYMIVYMFQCHSPKSSHPLPLPQSPKDCSIHLFYTFAVSHTGLSLPSF